MTSLIPIPQAPVTVRPATLDDLPFIDALQKKHSKQVGFLQRQALEGKIAAGEVLVAEEGRQNTEDSRQNRGEGTSSCCILSSDFCLPRTPIGYIIGADRYFKRDDMGIIYHLNVVPGKQRSFVGATLLKAMFDRAAYGCKLFCCWCAQDIEANRFWESMGFAPLAYRAGSEKRGKKGLPRVHIFWQKRILEGDTTTPWWFPAQTTGGAMGAGRIVLPIPPGKRWSDELVTILPKESLVLGDSSLIKDKGQRTKDKGSAAMPAKPQAALRQRKPVNAHGGLFFAPPASPAALPAAVASETIEKPKRACPERSRGEKKPKAKNDPKLVAAARELRDRWLEHVNSGQTSLEASGKYDVTRALRECSSGMLPYSPAALLPAA